MVERWGCGCIGTFDSGHKLVYVLKPNINAQTFLSLDIDCSQPTILEAGRKFRFEIKTMKTQLLAGIICQLLVFSTEYLLFPVISKLV